MKKKLVFPILGFVFLITLGYLSVDQNIGGIFRTPTPTITDTATCTITSSDTLTDTPSFTPTDTPKSTDIPTYTPTASPTHTFTPTNTRIPILIPSDTPEKDSEGGGNPQSTDPPITPVIPTDEG